MHNPETLPSRSLRTDGSNFFAHHTMTARLPAVIEETITANPDYPSSVRDDLSRLADEILNDRPIRPIAAPAPDWEGWQELHHRHGGESWLDTEWFYAEHLVYRRLIEAVRWWETGRDPFAPIKAAEYGGKAHRELLGAALEGEPDGGEEGLATLLALSLWGNRIDLSYKASAALGAGDAHPDDLVLDQRPEIVSLLLEGRGSGRSIHLVTDNAGSELTMDLLLVDVLISIGYTVVIHVKLHPTYVSDATGSDIWGFVQRLARGVDGVDARRFGERLARAFDRGVLRIIPDHYWHSGRFIAELPRRIAEPLSAAALVIFKGDMNYRRFSRDTVWAPDEGFEGVVGSFPAPVALLRTMKSDTLFAFPPARAEELAEADPAWRSNGRRGIIQFFG